MSMYPRMFGITITPELLAKLFGLLISLGVLWEKVDTIDHRVQRIEAYIDSKSNIVVRTSTP